MIFSKNERVMICELSNHTLQIFFDAWWTLMNVCSKHPIACNNSRHATSWWFICTVELRRPGSPGFICIDCHHVLPHPSEHGISSMGKHLVAKAHIAKLNEVTNPDVTELTSSMVDGTALAILMKQPGRGITIVSSQRKFIFDILLNPYWSKWQTKCSKLAAKDYETSEIHQATWNRYLKLRFLLAHIPLNAISSLDLRRSYEELRSVLVLPYTTRVRNMCQREYALTVDAIKKQ